MIESFKVVLVGDSNVGKTSIIQRYTKDSFDSGIEPTVGAHFMTRIIDLEEHGGSGRMKLQIWDTAGQEKYKSVTQIYYRDAAAAICVYDVTSQLSLDAAERWLDDLRRFSPPHTIIALAANKCDLFSQQEVSLEMGQDFKDKHEVPILQQTSAKENTGIEELFVRVAREIDRNREIIKQGSGTTVAKRSQASLASAAQFKKPDRTGCKC